MFERRFPNAGEAVEYLKRRTVEQKNEEPRQKFVEDLRLIHDRKKNEPFIPILPGHEQEAWFAKLESNGIWTRVLGFITNPSDMTSAYYSCEMFRKHLEERRKMALMRKVFEVFRDTGRLQYSGFKNTTDEKKEQSKEVLKHRLVSKTWKEMTEEVLMLSSNLSPSKPTWHPENWNWDGPLVCRFGFIFGGLMDLFCLDGGLDLALKKLGNASTCTNLVRFMTVDDTFCRDENAFYLKLEEFLAIHGKSVWGLKISMSVFKYDKLCNILSSMSNLKALKLNGYWRISERESVGNQLREMIVRNPIPVLPSLEFCRLQCITGRTDFLVAAILESSPNLKAVSLGHYWGQSNVNSIAQVVWNALRDIKLEYFEMKYGFLNDHIFMEDVSHLENLGWLLRYLRFELESHPEFIFADGDIDISLPAIFTALKHFSKSLVEFSFVGDDIVALNSIEDQASVVIDFPKLEKIDFPTIKIPEVEMELVEG